MALVKQLKIGRKKKFGLVDHANKLAFPLIVGDSLYYTIKLHDPTVSFKNIYIYATIVKFDKVYGELLQC